MKKLLSSFFYCIALYSSAQPIATDSSLVIKPFFTPGETRTYLVSEESKVDTSPLFPIKAESKYKIEFKVLDTTKGYTILYSVKTIATSNKRWVLQSLKANVSNSINFIYRLRKEGWVVDYVNFNSLKRQLIFRLDSIAASEKFGESDQKEIGYLRRNLERGGAVEEFIKPFMLFNDLFTKQTFRNRKDFVASNRRNMLYQPTLPGVLILELRDVNRNNNKATVKVDFVGNRDSAAKYTNLASQEFDNTISRQSIPYKPSEMRNDFTRNYEMMLQTGWPALITDKEVEFYLQKITYKTKMTLVEN